MKGTIEASNISQELYFSIWPVDVACHSVSTVTRCNVLILKYFNESRRLSLIYLNRIHNVMFLRKNHRLIAIIILIMSFHNFP
jgi:hypothetical protein